MIRQDATQRQSLSVLKLSGSQLSLFQIVVVMIIWMGSSICPVKAADHPTHIELQFELPQLQGNPFDYTANDVQVVFSPSTGTPVSVPAFFDGGTTWRARFRPGVAGRYTVGAITLNGKDAHAAAISQTEFDVPAMKDPGFVRIDPKNKMRFAFDDGSPFYPVGYDLAWRSRGEIEMPPLVDSLDRMGKAGVNWTRIWMNYWDGKNLDWPLASDEPLKIGTLLLPVARTWDDIVDTAEKNRIYFQMVLQHHGQYSSRTDTNWQLNPWNKINGGWLENPEDFFTDPRAIQLTKNKYRYILARWGYSPAIMAFELFNEVESTDGFKKDLASVAAWHKTMAQFLREQDPNHHLITTSSDTTKQSIWPATDYYQAHAYPSDLISAIAGLDNQKLERAYFYGEMGASSGSSKSSAETLHEILWASIMSGSAGTGEYWNWFDVEPQNLLGQFTSVQDFIKQSGLLKDPKLEPVSFDAQTANRSPLRFGPGRDWASSATTQYVVDPSGRVENLGGMSAFLQGTGANHAMFPFASFQVNYPQAGTFAVQVDQTTAAGAKLEASVDGKLIAAIALGKTRNENARLNATLEFAVPAGSHQVRLENTGEDWVHIHQFVLTPYASELAVLGKSSGKMAVLWVYRRDVGTGKKGVAGTIQINGLSEGSYQIVWWDCRAGKILQQTNASAIANRPLELTTPSIEQDAACWITPAR
jgi:hypothetical protein